MSKLVLKDKPTLADIQQYVKDMEADRGFIESAARLEIPDIEHDMAGPDDVEGRIEDVFRNGHVFPLSFRGDAQHRTRNLEVPGSRRCRAPERRL